MDFGKLRLDKQESARNMMYQNYGYQFERRDKKTLILDIVDTESVAPLSTTTEFTVDLFEPLTVDKLHRMYTLIVYLLTIVYYAILLIEPHLV